MTVRDFFESNPGVKTFVFDGYLPFSKKDIYDSWNPKRLLNAEIRDIKVEGDNKKIQRWARNSVTLFI